MTGIEIALWLAINIYYEARSEPLLAQQAVAHVTLNRSNVCGDTVRDTIARMGQYSWTAKRQIKTLLNPGDSAGVRVFSRCLISAQRAMRSYDFTEGTTYYYRADMSPPPSWASGMEIAGQWGAHVFMRGHPGDRAFCNAPIRALPSVAPHPLITPSPTTSTRGKGDEIRRKIKRIADTYRL